MDFYLNGTKISLTNPEKVFNTIKNHEYNESNYICLFGLYPLTQSFKDKILQSALNNSFLNPLHGKSIELYFRAKGHKNIQTTDGVYLLNRLLNEKMSHYFYGTNVATLNKIKDKINQEYPNAKIIGYKEPPLIEIDNIIDNPQIKLDFIEINKQKPNIIWIGLGGIKQDLVMYNYMKYLDKSLMIGVGAVFDYFAGNLSLSSEKVKKFGFRWLYRLFLQPILIKKIIRAVFLTITLFIKLLINRIFVKPKQP
ncbi:N-acetylglucosaminyldiphosphoundecaprenol N-acetyl-beta-D-mannosaminyltransferase [subsurface metagenome]